MAININLYPPIVNTYIPAFLVDSADEDKNICRIYFSLSSYNVLEDIQNVQVTVRNQYTNLSALDKSKYPSEVMLTSLKTDDTKTSDDKYYIEIKKEDMQGGKFEINQYYKVQMRFTLKTDETEISLDTPQKIDGWLAAYINLFSEWSTVCLIRGISEPELNISGFTFENGNIVWSNANPTIFGNLSFSNPDETEKLQSYQIKLYKNAMLVTDSETLYTSNTNIPNSFIYTFKYNFVPSTYTFEILYNTYNNYNDIYRQSFVIADEMQENLDLSISAIPEEENGRIILTIKNPTDIAYTGDLVIRRAASSTNFTIWEDIKNYSFTSKTNIKEMFSDNTIESGIWYKYCLVDTLNNTIKEIKKPMMVIFDDMFLTTKDRQLKLKFNPTVSSFKRTIQESRTDTLGSQFPFIRRNGHANYAQFPIGGLISFQMDEADLFTSLDELFGENLKLYTGFNETKRFTEANDWAYEKMFKDKVSEFLYDGQPKLFRSATEGNFIIKVMDVSLTPNATLGRRIVSFTATAYEIAECTVENFKKYNILEGIDE